MRSVSRLSMPRSASYLATLCSPESTTAVTPGTVSDVSAILVATITRRRHHHNPQIAPRPPRLPRQRDCQVRVHTALVKLVEHDGREVGEQRVGLQAGGQDSLGDDEEARLRAESALEAHLPADLAA